MRNFIAGFVVCAVLTSGSAIAASQITSRDIRNGTVRKIDLSNPLTDDVTIAGVFSGTSPAGNDEVIWGTPNGEGAFSSFDAAGMLVPSVTLSVTQLTVEWSSPDAPLAEGDVLDIVVYVNGEATGLGCTVRGPDPTCTADISAPVPPGAEVAMQIVTSGRSGDGPSTVQWSLIATR